MSAVRIGQVFVPGKLPQYTYNPRASRSLEQRVVDYLDETGTILTVAGPTKTGKSVLLQQVVHDSVWLDGQGIDGAPELYRRIADKLGMFLTHSKSVEESTSTEGAAGAEAGLLGFKLNAGVVVTGATGAATTASVERPLSAVLGELINSARPLVIDDFHFVSRQAQREIVRALKPAVLAGLPVIFVSISHRARDVVTAEPDMTGRVTALDVDFWSEGELEVIAEKGFAVLNVADPQRVTEELVKQSYGSPHLMQKFCREICKGTEVYEQQMQSVSLVPPDEWGRFFISQLDDASKDWFARLLRGPQQKGTQRTIWSLHNGQKLDGYGLTLAAIASTGPTLDITKDEITSAIVGLVMPPPESPTIGQTTRVLGHMSAIASKSATDPLPADEEIDHQIEQGNTAPDVQPVLEYIDRGPTSTLHIADPFFAFYLRWGSEAHLSAWTPPAPPASLDRPPNVENTMGRPPA